MKKLFLSIAATALSVLLTLSLKAQTTLQSTDGYSVTISVRPVGIKITQDWGSGYNYQVELNYTLSFSGNKSINLWDAEGTIGCGSKKNGFALPKTAGSGLIYTYNTTADGDSKKATVASLRCTQVELLISASGISRQTIVITQPVVLPVTFSGFTAVLNSNKVVLNWSTASELNNKYFTIERSASGNTWIALAQVNGAGTSNAANNYSYTDNTPADGTSYYRIRQTDIDGNSGISEIRTVKTSNTVSARIGLYPIPNSSNKITLTGVRDYNNYQLEVISTGGNTIYHAALTSASVELPQLTSGFYFVRITDKTTGEATSIRYVKN